MALAVSHKFTSAKADGTDASLLKPSNWNDTHNITCATNVLLGKASAGTGPVEELPTSAAVIALLAAADIPSFLAALGASPPTTGDGKLTLKVAADAGWLLLDDGTFGNVGSGATNRANADCLALFTLIYNNLSDAASVVYTSSGVPSTRAGQGSAATAWAALCRLSLPKQLGRAFVGAGAGSGLTARVLGTTFGEESHALTAAEHAAHQHAVYLKDIGHTHTYHGTGSSYTNGANTMIRPQLTDPTGAGVGIIDTATTGITIGSVNGTANDNLTASQGSGTAHNNTQASTAWNVMVKL